ncbi:NADH dehydrogenase [ubiquinone] iron-sulfur protein 6, mitochondrial [Adelges cooleyi]|uniref:NADH dehydrogenase [ubiquinone] iron-sulfur protein 6, mitochondrial n=1 Tax=Adelges cooleyi TaxID=133065 RepID=UPI00217F6F96|nr:NADH dehydrogenase [ubiquinone] iron-sulfur protein 6, mitochondrial [Adelges cooleyi]
MALNLLNLRTSVNLTKRMFLPSVVQTVKYSWEPKEVETHTGQKWDKDDYRLQRYIDKEKQVNPNFAIDLVKQVPPTECKERVVFCDGGGGPLGHPKVYINLDKPGNHSCGYCGLRFVKEEGGH